MGDELGAPQRKKWWILLVFVAAAFAVWCYAGTGISTVVSCRIAGGRPTTMPTTVQLSSETDARPVSVMVPACIKP